MNKTILSLCLLGVSVPVLADTSAIVAANNQLMVQRLSTNVDYTETGSGIFGTRIGILDTETGPVPGMALSVSTMRGPGHAYLYAEFDNANGSTTYIGAPLVGNAPYGSIVSTSSATLMDFSGRFGKGYALQEQFMLTPYGEIGHHLWDRGVNYGETYTHYYVGLGVLAQYVPVDRLVLSGNAMLGKTFLSYITINSGPGLNGFAGSLGNSSLSRLGVAADFAFNQELHGSVSVDYTRFQYGISSIYPVGGGFVAWEPDSKTKYRTVKFGLGVAF